jgi:hypothetical protein
MAIPLQKEPLVRNRKSPAQQKRRCHTIHVWQPLPILTLLARPQGPVNEKVGEKNRPDQTAQQMKSPDCSGFGDFEAGQPDTTCGKHLGVVVVWVELESRFF